MSSITKNDGSFIRLLNTQKCWIFSLSFCCAIHLISLFSLHTIRLECNQFFFLYTFFLLCVLWTKSCNFILFSFILILLLSNLFLLSIHCIANKENSYSLEIYKTSKKRGKTLFVNCLESLSLLLSSTSFVGEIV